MSQFSDFVMWDLPIWYTTFSEVEIVKNDRTEYTETTCFPGTIEKVWGKIINFINFFYLAWRLILYRW